MHLNGETTGTIEIWRGQVNLGSNHSTGIDGIFNFLIGIGLQAAGRANGRHPGGKIQTRKAVSHFRVHGENPGDAALSSRTWIEKMVMHADQAGNYRSSRQVDGT